MESAIGGHRAIQVSKCISVINPTSSGSSSRVHVHVCRLSDRCAIVSVDSCNCHEDVVSAQGPACVELPSPTTAAGSFCNLALALTRKPTALVTGAAGASGLPSAMHTCIYETADSARTLEGSVSERMAASLLRSLSLPTPLQLFFSLNVPLPATTTDNDLSVTQVPQASLEFALVQCLRDILS